MEPFAEGARGPHMKVAVDDIVEIMGGSRITIYDPLDALEPVADG